MPPSFSLSYVLSTRNKLPMLREVMTRLLQSLQQDEEVIVIDAASTDGTAEYLKELHARERIHQLVSEPDHGEAHGYNKGLLLARGAIIKLLTDDDAFHWPSLQTCRQFMEDHPEVDVLGSDGAVSDWSQPNPFVRSYHGHGFEGYRLRGTEFEFCGLGLLLRRGSLALTGLFDPRFLRVDLEFTLRLTSGPANLAWFTGCPWLRLENRQSNSVTANPRAIGDTIRLRRYYGVVHTHPAPATIIRDLVRTLFRPVKHNWLGRTPKELSSSSATIAPTLEWAEVFSQCDAWLAKENREHPGTFLTK